MAETLSIGTGRGIKITIEGSTPQDIVDGVNRLGKLPISAVNMPVKKSATKVKRLAVSYAPIRSGALKKGILVRGRKEQGSTRGKVVYDVWMDPGMNDVFAKYSSGGKRYYYPASQEYGFRIRGTGHVDGKYYLKRAADTLNGYHEQLVLDEVDKRLDKLWAKKNGGNHDL